MNEKEVILIDPLEHQEKVLHLLSQLNPNMEADHIEQNLNDMARLPNYLCFALKVDGEIEGISSGWTTVKIYSGKQLELDNVIIDSPMQSKGLGKYFIQEIRQWSIGHGYQVLALNTYVGNAGSHKFYFNEGFKIIGFHFEQTLNTQK